MSNQDEDLLFSQAGYLGKEGDFGDGPAGLHTFFGILAGTIPVVVAVNSDLVDDISAIVQASLFAATSPGSRHAGDPPGPMKT